MTGRRLRIKFRTKKPDTALKQIGAALKPYAAAHPEAVIELYRYSNVSVRVRIVDPDLAEARRRDRGKEIWKLFDDLPEEVRADVTMLVLLTPEEKPAWIGSFVF